MSVEMRFELPSEEIVPPVVKDAVQHVIEWTEPTSDTGLRLSIQIAPKKRTESIGPVIQYYCALLHVFGCNSKVMLPGENARR
ncbi:hypothetical protein WS69_14600 [Burkholderia sp. BDU5]|nr:hypothetical protein WS69_14600 [Burkholderia sp. BDU5]